jgi:hypothetical protein
MLFLLSYSDPLKGYGSLGVWNFGRHKDIIVIRRTMCARGRPRFLATLSDLRHRFCTNLHLVRRHKGMHITLVARTLRNISVCEKTIKPGLIRDAHF